jgi:hypothetical protein
VPFRADGFALRAFRSPGSRIAASVSPSQKSLPDFQWRCLDEGSPLTVARQLRLRTGFPWCPEEILAFCVFCDRLVGSGQLEVAGFARRGHREVEAVGGEGELEVGGREAGPSAAHQPRISLAVSQRL